MTTTLTITGRVQAGAAWLDEQRPGWWQRIDLDTLDLGEPCRCVLGQEFAAEADHESSSRRNGYRVAALHWLDEDPERLGFCLPLKADDREAGWAQLNAAWRELILVRRAGTETTR